MRADEQASAPSSETVAGSLRTPGVLVRSLARDPWVLATAVLAAVLAAAYLLPVLSLDQRIRLTNRFATLAIQVVCVLALTHRLSDIGSRAELALWRGLAITSGLWAAVLVLLTVTDPERSLALDLVVDVLYAVSYLVWIVAVERAPHRREGAFGDLTRPFVWIGGGVFVVGLLAYFALVPSLVNREDYTSLVPSMLLFLACDIYLLTRVTQFWLEARSARWRALWGMIALATSAFMGNDVFEALVRAGVFTPSPGAVTDMLWLLPYGLLILAARARHLDLVEDEEATALGRVPTLPRDQLILFALIFPAIHLVGYRFASFDPVTRSARDSLVLVWLLVLGGLALRQGRALSRRVRTLTREKTLAAKVSEQREALLRVMTERQEAEDAWRSSEEKFVKAFRSSPDAMVISTLVDGRLMEVNDSFERLSGYQRDEVIGRTVGELNLWLHPQERERVLSLLKREGSVRMLDVEHRSKNGEVFTTQLSADLIEVDGETCALTVIRDVTASRRAEQVLRASEERFSTAFLANPEPAILMTLETGILLEVNDAFCQISGYERDEAVGRNGVELGLWEPGQAQTVGDLVRQDGSIRGLDIDYRTRSGESRSILLSVETVELDQEVCLLCVARDITERKALESQLLRAQRMDSIGTLAGGIAHDLNNVLAPIMMSIQLLRLDEEREQRLELLDILEVNTRRGADMVRQVLSYARGVEGKRQELQPGRIVEELERIVGETFPKTLDVAFACEADLPVIRGDATQIHQVLLNLCVNARDAIGRQGRLAVKVSLRTVDESFCRAHVDARLGDYLTLEVSDTGCGIEPAALERIFEPFFTTKAVGEGTGLGLSTVDAIVKSHGGFVTVASEIGFGSCFTVFLPASTPQRQSETATLASAAGRGKGELVLLVDDEQGVLAVAARTLRRHGYEVATAEDGAEAIAFYTDHPDQVKAVVLDMMMPRMDGPETIRLLREMDTEVPIIASSGLASREDLVDAQIQAFLAKPFTGEELLLTLSNVLRR